MFRLPSCSLNIGMAQRMLPSGGPSLTVYAALWWPKFNNVCCPLVAPLLAPLVNSMIFLPRFSELLQSLDMCENDPVAIARCFVDKVRVKIQLVLNDSEIRSC